MPQHAPDEEAVDPALDVELAWPVTDDGDSTVAGPAASAAPTAPPPEPLLPSMAAQLRELSARLDGIEQSLANLTELVELVIDTMPGSAEGSG